ncbi:MAG TPA: type II CRISPR RNA-guided endonuclease Cas9 [Planctomycetaceae bacterium]|nr:type II CRISPR RNA-guided endonuclease Cas9 [Planctomycetaceae bacterium]
MQRLKEYVLGIDIGTTSIGWAVVETHDGQPTDIVRTGVRIFEAGVDGTIEKGKDSSRAAARRTARQQRRQTFRRKCRIRRVARCLENLGLLPTGAGGDGQTRHRVLDDLDCALREVYCPVGHDISQQVWVYTLRATAGMQPLPRFHVGRALLHLAQRRGFRSGSKQMETKADDTEQGEIKEAIEKLSQELSGRTLAEVFCQRNPHQQRIRKNWTAREMYQAEFAKIWATQASSLGLTDDAKQELAKAIFYQRPLRSSKGLIGRCSLETKHRRAPAACLAAQEFRILQTVNHLRLQFADGMTAPLIPEQRDQLISALNEKSKLTTATAKKLLAIPKTVKFSIESHSEKELPGNRTATPIVEILGQRWLKWTESEQDALIDALLSFQKAHALTRHLQKRWGLSVSEAEQLAEIRLETGYCRHSRQALAALLPHMRQGLAYANAVEAVYGSVRRPTKPRRRLPVVSTAIPDMTNPAVHRALSELRKVVNAVLQQFGKPTRIRIELARDLKRSRVERKRLSELNDKNQKQREAALRKLVAECPGARESRDSIEKILLAEECGWECPFTGDGISMQTLFGSTPRFDVAHIYPRRYLDNSFANKTLCRSDVNRNRMYDLLPRQAFASNTEEWNLILTRVKGFKSTSAAEKLRRFQAEAVPDDFVSRQLNDTRYNSVIAAQYLSLLYGGRSDEQGQRIEAVTGGMTAVLRSVWRLHKSRDDHRHHALDAVVIACTDAGTVRLLQSAAAEADRHKTRLTEIAFPAPFSGFAARVEESLGCVAVSFRPDRRVQGAFHDQTLYGRPVSKSGKPEKTRLRKELHKLSRSEIEGEQIVDPVIRRIVQEKWASLGKPDPKRVFADPANHPVLREKSGGVRPIHKVRVWQNVKPAKIATDDRERFVQLNANDHTVIYAELSEDGSDQRWRESVVTRFEALSRVRFGDPPVLRTLQQGLVFRFSLRRNDCIELADPDGMRRLYRIMNVSKGDMQIQQLSDARSSKVLRDNKLRLRITNVDELRRRCCRKVQVSPLGDVFADNT